MTNTSTVYEEVNGDVIYIVERSRKSPDRSWRNTWFIARPGAQDRTLIVAAQVPKHVRVNAGHFFNLSDFASTPAERIDVIDVRLKGDRP